ncbi:MAG: hypothetical protein U0802_11895 [Candidatus Binatia bacterium]
MPRDTACVPNRPTVDRRGLVGELDRRAQRHAVGQVEAELRHHRVARARDVEHRARLRRHVTGVAVLVLVVDAVRAQRDHRGVEAGELHQVRRRLRQVLDARELAAQRLLGFLAVGVTSVAPW